MVLSVLWEKTSSLVLRLVHADVGQPKVSIESFWSIDRMALLVLLKIFYAQVISVPTKILIADFVKQLGEVHFTWLNLICQRKEIEICFLNIPGVRNELFASNLVCLPFSAAERKRTGLYIWMVFSGTAASQPEAQTIHSHSIKFTEQTIYLLSQLGLK